jgi:hypothetical protein
MRPEENSDPHPEELVVATATTSVSKDGHKHRVPALALRDASLCDAPQGEGSDQIV